MVRSLLEFGDLRAFGIDPATIVYNHLNQPRELVKAAAVTKLFAGDPFRRTNKLKPDSLEAT